jgi:hypothetical protein
MLNATFQFSIQVRKVKDRFGVLWQNLYYLPNWEVCRASFVHRDDDSQEHGGRDHGNSHKTSLEY